MLDAAPGQLRDLVDQCGRVTGENAAGVSGRGCTLAGREDVDVAAKRECRGHGATGNLAESGQLGPPGPQFLGRPIDRMPGCAEPDRAAERGAAVAPDPDRRVRLLRGLGLEDQVTELSVLAGKRRVGTGPQLAHRLEIL